MTCREAIEFMIDYLDGTLTPPTREAFERHLALCVHCVAYLRTYEQSIRMASRSFSNDIPVPEEMIQAILASRGM